ncbi:chaperonin 10-like protein, partial [Leptodontidium sp. 2 PMI_412]
MAGCVYGTQTHQHAEREGVHNPSQNILADELSSKPKNFAAILPSPLAQLEVASVPYPECRDEELIIKNHVVAINPVDWKIQSPMGRNFNLTYPVILGEDVAGEVVEVGTKAKSKFAVGDRVMAHPLGLGNGAAYGGFQLYPVLKAATVSKIPDSLTFKEAAVLPLSTSTAAAGLFMKSTLGMNYPPVNPGRSKAVKRSALLVWGCSSSVGSSVVQLADAAGYYLITTASPSNHEYCKALGADHVLNYHDTDIVKQIIDHFGGKKIVGVYDAIGSDITVRQSATVLHTLGGGKIA